MSYHGPVPATCKDYGPWAAGVLLERIAYITAAVLDIYRIEKEIVSPQISQSGKSKCYKRMSNQKH